MSKFHENVISPEQAVTLDGLFYRRFQRSPERPGYQFFDRDSKSWQTLSWGEMLGHIARWQRALASEGLKPGDRVAMLLRNCPEWVIFDQAALSLGLVTVPLYTDDRPDNAAYILADAGVKLLLVQEAGRWRNLAPALPTEGGSLKRVLLLSGGDGAEQLLQGDARLRLLADWLPEDAVEYEPRKGADPHALASIVYTSGTTGRPKGVMLSHHNMLSVAHASIKMLDVYEEDLFLSFLPLSHTLERTAGYYLSVMTGSCVAYARSVGQLADDLQTVRPTLMIAVPRVFERIYGRLSEKLSKQGKIAAWLFRRTVAIGWSRFQYQQGRGGWRLGFLFWPLLDRLVASKVTARLGGRLRGAVSGGAPLGVEVARVFIGLGVPIIQGYGLTETSPIVSANPLQNNVPASVGIPVSGVKVRIGAQDELLVSGPGVMLGYWNNHRATREMIDADGWLHTGDQARIEGEHIFITGRIKDILVLSNGEKVPPGDMEGAILLDPYIDQVLVLGEGQPYLSALVVLDGEHWPKLAQSIGVDPLNAESLQNPRVQQAVQHRIRDALRDFPGYAKIRRVHLTLEPWTLESGLLTPTLKLKRAKVVERYAAEIDALYHDGPTNC